MSLKCNEHTANLLYCVLYAHLLQFSAEGQNRTGDTLIFSQVLYQLSYLGERGDCTLAGGGCQAWAIHASTR